jgi:hypothetical protein
MMSKKITIEAKLNTIPDDWKLGMFITVFPNDNSFS